MSVPRISRPRRDADHQIQVLLMLVCGVEEQGVEDPPHSRDVLITLSHFWRDANLQYRKLLEKSLRPLRSPAPRRVVPTGVSFPSSRALDPDKATVVGGEAAGAEALDVGHDRIQTRLRILLVQRCDPL